MRRGVEGLRTGLVNEGRDFPPHPGPLPLGGGEGESFAGLGGLIVILSSILRIRQKRGCRSLIEPWPIIPNASGGSGYSVPIA